VASLPSGATIRSIAVSTPALSVDERRARLAVRHRQAPSAKVDDDVTAIARDLVVAHATDPATMVLSLALRMATPDPSAVERALYDDRTLVRMLGMRRTLFAVPVDLAPVVHASSTVAVAADERRKLEILLEQAEISRSPGQWLRRLEHKVLSALEALGEAEARELTARVPDLGRKVVVGPGSRNEATVNLTSRVLVLLGADGKVVRGRPKGRWSSSQHRWAPYDRWIGRPMPELDATEAKATLARRWLERFGPGTVADLKWWTGWTLGATRAAVAACGAVEVDLDGAPGIALPDDLEPTDDPGPWVALLPGLDATAMGWSERAWYLADDHRRSVMDRNGNIGPTVWADGRVVGGWAQRKDGEVAVRLLEDIGAERTRLLSAEVGRLQSALGDVRVTPRFPAPLDKELVAEPVKVTAFWRD
jgi:hypothetical protein